MAMERKIENSRPRRFLDGSKLHIFLSFKEPEMISLYHRDYTLGWVLESLRHVISQEKLYDKKNKTCLRASSDLFWALGMPFLHISELRDVVLCQMVAIEPPSKNQPTLGENDSFDKLHSEEPIPPEFAKLLFDVGAPYLVRPEFLKVNSNTTIFYYRDVCTLLSKYILNNKDKFFDNRNIRIADVSDDILGEAFNVNIFHRSQVTMLIRRQLLPLESFITLRSGKTVAKGDLAMWCQE